MKFMQRKCTIVIGGSGTIGRRLIRRLAAEEGLLVVACLHRSPLPDWVMEGGASVICEYGVDVRNYESLSSVFRKYGTRVECVWNLAAPLSVDTAKDPDAAREITVGGMQRILKAMHETGCKKICFTDSIGSYGSNAPREMATASWLADNPHQDPGSDYGRFKRGCREAMARYADAFGFDCRWAVVPGVLHTDDVWGSGTTEYALSACEQFSEGKRVVFPLSPDTRLPMIHSDDLITGLIALQLAPPCALLEKQSGYALAGFSFSARELFQYLKKVDSKIPDFAVEYDDSIKTFSELWPDTLDPRPARRDLKFVAQRGMEDTIREILAAWIRRSISLGSSV